MTRVYLLDANLCSRLTNPRSQDFEYCRERLDSLGRHYPALSVVTISEIEYGLAHEDRVSPEYAECVRSFVGKLPSLDIEESVAHYYGQLRYWLFAKYSPRQRRVKKVCQLVDPITDELLGIDENDLWLVSHALAVDGVLATADRMTRLQEAAEATGMKLRYEYWSPKR